MIKDIKDPLFLKCKEYQKEVTGAIRLFFPEWKYKSLFFSWEGVQTAEERKTICRFLEENGFSGVILSPLSSLPDLPPEENKSFLRQGLLLTGNEKEEDLLQLKTIREEWERKNESELFLAGTPAVRCPEDNWEEKEAFTRNLMELGFDFSLCGKYSRNSMDPLLRPDFFTVYPMVLRDGNKEEALARLTKYLTTNYFQSPLTCCRIHTVCGRAPLLPCEECLALLRQKKEELYLPTTAQLREYLSAWKILRSTADGKKVQNMASTELFLEAGNIPLKLAPGATLTQHGGGEEKISLEITAPEKIPYMDSMPEERYTDAPNGTFFYPGGKAKAVTFSYDDGPRTDIKLIEILDKYGLKGTFNLNGNGVITKMQIWDDWNLEIYRNHEIATHNFRHISFSVHTKEQILTEMYWDRRVLETLSERFITGHAYASSALAGAVQTAQDALKALGITYARVTSPSGENFALPRKWLYWEPCCHHSQQGDLLEKGENFLKTDEQKMHLMLVWGHVTELDRDNTYGMMEEFCKRMAECKERIFFATNGEIADYLQACERCRNSGNGKSIKNTSFTTLFAAKEGKILPIAPGETLIF